MSEQTIRTAHERFSAALREQPAEPATTTLHRPNCTRPGWVLAQCRRPSGVHLARCGDCGSVELRTTTTEETQ